MQPIARRQYITCSTCNVPLLDMICSLKDSVSSLKQWPPENNGGVWPEDMTSFGHLTVSNCTRETLLAYAVCVCLKKAHVLPLGDTPLLRVLSTFAPEQTRETALQATQSRMATCI